MTTRDAALALTGVLADHGVPAWWLMPVAVVLTLFGSLRRATRKHGPR